MEISSLEDRIPAFFRADAWARLAANSSREQPPVEVERPLPALELGIKRLAESSRPHLHRITSGFAVVRRADERANARAGPGCG